MLETLTVDHMEWHGASSDELGYTGEAMDNAELRRHTNRYGQQFNLFSVGKGPVYITTPSLDARIEPSYQNRTGIIAKHLNGRVISCEIPGVTIDLDDPQHTRGAYQMPWQTLAALSGSYELLAAEMLRAIIDEFQLKDGQDVNLYGESLATKVMVGMLEAINHQRLGVDLKVGRVDFIEPINSSSTLSLRSLRKVVNELQGPEATRRKLYLKENKKIQHGHLKPFERSSDENRLIDEALKSRQFSASYVSAMGIRKGLHRPILHIMADRSAGGLNLLKTEFRFLHGIDSKVSSIADAERLVDAIKTLGGKAFQYAFIPAKGDKTPLGHNFSYSVGRTASWARQARLN